jgi:hypothetical protein
MTYFAKVVNKKVVTVILAEQNYIDTFIDSSPGDWVETFTSNYAGIGYTYHKNDNAFYAPQPYPSWTLNETTWTWEAPTPYPDDGLIYNWDEENLEWSNE